MDRRTIHARTIFGAFSLVFSITVTCTIAPSVAYAGGFWKSVGTTCAAMLSRFKPAPKALAVTDNANIVHQATEIESFWRNEFLKRGWEFNDVGLTTYSGAALSAGAVITSDMGPVYNMKDKTVYFDPAFFAQFQNRVGPASNPFLILILAHEIGHHIQNLRRSLERVYPLILSNHNGDTAQAMSDLSLRMERQADCLAGMYFGYLQRQGLVTTEQVAEAGARAFIMGSDMQVIINIFAGQFNLTVSNTHPSAQDRLNWFNHGVNNVDMSACEPFPIPVLN